jgi:hypothetical protein
MCGGIQPEELSRLIADAVYEGFKRLPRQVVTPENENHAPKGIPGRRKKMLTPVEIEAEFGIKSRLLQRWRRAGIGPAYANIGRRVFYNAEVFEKFLQAGSIRTTGFVDL